MKSESPEDGKFEEPPFLARGPQALLDRLEGTILAPDGDGVTLR